MQKDQEVSSYLDKYPQLQQELTTQRASVTAEVQELRVRLHKYRKIAEGSQPTGEMLQDVRTTLQYKQMQANDAEETSVRILGAACWCLLLYFLQSGGAVPWPFTN